MVNICSACWSTTLLSYFILSTVIAFAALMVNVKKIFILYNGNWFQKQTIYMSTTSLKGVKVFFIFRINTDIFVMLVSCGHTENFHNFTGQGDPPFDNKTFKVLS